MRRHDLAYLRAGSACRHDQAAPEFANAIVKWIADARPLVVTRQDAPQAGEVQLALTLPAHLGRQRLACFVKRAAVLRVRPPLRLSDCLARLDAPTRTVLARLEAAILSTGAELGVYGSLAWETLSAESYRHAASDIDLICDVASREQLQACLAALAAAAQYDVAIDGEVRFPAGDAVAWRELLACRDRPAAQVLVKGPRAVGLKPLAALLATLHEEPLRA
jgi:phosphoribosyl-dephospho-CoA transferase